VAVSLDDVVVKVEAGEKLSAEDMRALDTGRDIITLGILADSVRRRLRGNIVTFVRVFDLALSGGSLEAADVPAPAGEVRILKTPGTLSDAVSVVTEARDRAGAVPLSAFCLAELSNLPDGLPVVLPALKQAGLELIAQAPLDRLAAPEHALEAVTDAGLRLARLTIGDPTQRAWTEVCREVAAHQRRLQSLTAFAPLSRTIDQTRPTTGYADVKRVALSRILVQNVDTIQVDWALYGPKLAQVALTFGVDDLDSVSALDDESQGHRRSAVEEVRRSIQVASFTAVERDARFRPV
jgi:aminodeoxyfutalosine synthase